MGKKILFFTLLVLTFLCELQSSMLLGMAQPIDIKDIDDIPRLCVNLMEQLLAQEAKEKYGKTALAFKHKILPIKCLNDGEIFALLSRFSKFKLKLDVNAGMFTDTGMFIGRESPKPFESIIIWLPQEWEFNKIVNEPDYDRLRQLFQDSPMLSTKLLNFLLLPTYEQVVESMKNNWEFFATVPPGNVVPPKGMEDCILFTKEGDSILVPHFINKLAKKFNLDEHIHCSGTATQVYLWVKKDALQEFNRIFKFKDVTGQPLATCK